ncbi:hypothetical protein C6341_g27134 [Phytophthora cactorum]|nr:hypothetical protein C6341_g27134 [Phytophthora cactorum]
MQLPIFACIATLSTCNQRVYSRIELAKYRHNCTVGCLITCPFRARTYDKPNSLLVHRHRKHPGETRVEATTNDQDGGIAADVDMRVSVESSEEGSDEGRSEDDSSDFSDVNSEEESDGYMKD